MPKAPTDSPPKAEPEQERQVRNYGPNQTGWKEWRAVDHGLAEHVVYEPGANPVESRDTWQFLTVIIVVLGSIALLALLGLHLVEAKNSAEPAPELSREKVLRGEALVKRLHERVRGYFGATSVDAMVAHVAEPDRVRSLMLSYYRTHPIKPRRVRKVDLTASVMRQNTKHPHMLATVLSDDGRIAIVILREQDNDLRIDWEALVGYNRVTLDELIRYRPTDPIEVRVRLQFANYYNYEFEDSKAWRSYKLTSPGEPDVVIYGYCPRGGAICKRFDKLTLGGRSVFARIKLQFPEAGNGSNVAEITEIIAENWLGGDA